MTPSPLANSLLPCVFHSTTQDGAVVKSAAEDAGSENKMDPRQPPALEPLMSCDAEDDMPPGMEALHMECKAVVEQETRGDDGRELDRQENLAAAEGPPRPEGGGADELKSQGLSASGQRFQRTSWIPLTDEPSSTLGERPMVTRRS